MTSLSNQIGARAEPRTESQSVDYVQEVSSILVDANSALGKFLPADIAPLPEVKALELISGRLNPEYLRLAVPSAASPFASSPLRPRQDYYHMLAVAGRPDNSIAKQLVALLHKPSKDISEGDISHMRASLARENNMINVLKAYLGNVEKIHEGITRDREG